MNGSIVLVAVGCCISSVHPNRALGRLPWLRFTCLKFELFSSCASFLS